mgnify:FL=1
MALWGNKDSIDSAGTVTVRFYDSWNYPNIAANSVAGVGINTFVGITTAEVIGSGTSFGATGNCSIGDMIEFGDYSAGTYFGDAVILGIASATNLTIGSTAGLSGAAISGVAYHVSQAPKYTVQDSSFSAVNETAAGINTLGFIGTASTAVGIGTSAFGISNLKDSEIRVADLFLNNDVTYTVTNVGRAEVSSMLAVGIGSTTIRVNIAPGLNVGTDYLQQGGEAYKVTGIGETQGKVGTAGVGTDKIPLLGADIVRMNLKVGDTLITPLNGGKRITAVSSTLVTVASTIANAATGLAATITSPDIVNLQRGISEAYAAAGIATFLRQDANGAEVDTWVTGNRSGAGAAAAVAEGDSIEFQRFMDGYSKYTYGVAAGAVGVAQSTAFETGVGWVGVTTYRDTLGQLRVKKEILVSASGITTGANSELYPPHLAV